VVEDACLREAGSGGGASGEDTGCSTMPISACLSYLTAVSRRVLLTLCQPGRLQVHDAFVSVGAVLSTNRIHHACCALHGRFIAGLQCARLLSFRLKKVKDINTFKVDSAD